MDFSNKTKTTREQLCLSQNDSVRVLSVSIAMANRGENSNYKQSNMAQRLFGSFTIENEFYLTMEKSFYE